MIKNLLFSIVAIFSSSTIAQNSIVGIYEDKVITLRQLESVSKENDSKDKKISAIHALISENIELDYIKKLKISPTSSSINDELVNVAKLNNIKLDELKKFSNFDEIYSLVVLKLSKIGLRQIVVNQDRIEPISLTSKEGLSIFQDWLNNTKAKMYIEIYDEKL